MNRNSQITAGLPTRNSTVRDIMLMSGTFRHCLQQSHQEHEHRFIFVCVVFFIGEAPLLPASLYKHELIEKAITNPNSTQ
jgi:hypothetical protein